MAVHYYSMENLEKWKSYTNCQYQLVSDPERRLYNLFGMGCTQVYSTQWAIKVTHLYAAEYIVTEDPVPLLETEPGDTFYIGGDVVVDRRGRVVYSFISPTPPDRPSVGDVLACVANHKATMT